MRIYKYNVGDKVKIRNKDIYATIVRCHYNSVVDLEEYYIEYFDEQGRTVGYFCNEYLFEGKEVRNLAKAFQCDRCKKYFSEKDLDGSIYPYIVNIKEGGEYNLDLCPTCKEKLVQFINVKENQQ